MCFNGNLRYQVLYKATGGRETRFGCFRQYVQTWGFKNGHWQHCLIGISSLLRYEWTLRITHLKQIIWKGTRKGLTHVGHHHLALTFEKEVYLLHFPAAPSKWQRCRRHGQWPVVFSLFCSKVLGDQLTYHGVNKDEEVTYRGLFSMPFNDSPPPQWPLETPHFFCLEPLP